MEVHSHADANSAMMETWFLSRTGMFEPLAEALHRAVVNPNPAEGVVDFVNITFANRDQLSTEARTMAAGVADYVGRLGLFGMSEDNKAVRMGILLRDGEAEAPSVDARYMFNPEAEAPPAPPVPGEEAQ